MVSWYNRVHISFSILKEEDGAEDEHEHRHDGLGSSLRRLGSAGGLGVAAASRRSGLRQAGLGGGGSALGRRSSGTRAETPVVDLGEADVGARIDLDELGLGRADELVGGGALLGELASDGKEVARLLGHGVRVRPDGDTGGAVSGGQGGKLSTEQVFGNPSLVLNGLVGLSGNDHLGGFELANCSSHHLVVDLGSVDGGKVGDGGSVGAGDFERVADFIDGADPFPHVFEGVVPAFFGREGTVVGECLVQGPAKRPCRKLT